MNRKKDNKGDSVELGRVLEKLDNISNSVEELKDDARDNKGEMYAQSIKIATLEAEMQNFKKTIYGNNSKGGEQKTNG